ncbi:MAG: hypothetical protein CEN87_546 [Parcubacteria group bacterium Licking1014_1]|nr:MAG: hypothetical protein CEN87_546 [Parcubacteria group bacterium Licking1014_1]
MIKDYRNKFKEITGIAEQTVSTVDHVYASMPVRLIDSHHILHKMGNVKVLIWDDIYPKLKRYKSELVVDCGILSANRQEYFLFPPEKIYGLSHVLSPEFDKQMEDLKICLDLILNLPKYEKHLLTEKYLERFKIIVDLYRKVLSQNPKNSPLFYKNLVIEIYNFLGFNNIAEFYRNSAESFMSTGIIDKFLPWLIEDTKNESFGLKYLINNSPLFPPPYFRYINDNKAFDRLKTQNEINEANNLLKMGKLLPSKEVMYWLFAMSGLKHFGRDFGFLNKLEEYFISELNIKNKFSELQLTSEKDDGTFYIQYEKDVSYRMVCLNNKIKARKCPISRKSTDVSTIPSIYLHIGNRFKKLYEKYIESKNIYYIKMGEILI